MKEIPSKDAPEVSGGFAPDQDCFPPLPQPLPYPIGTPTGPIVPSPEPVAETNPFAPM